MGELGKDPIFKSKQTKDMDGCRTLAGYANAFVRTVWSCTLGLTQDEANIVSCFGSGTLGRN